MTVLGVSSISFGPCLIHRFEPVSVRSDDPLCNKNQDTTKFIVTRETLDENKSWKGILIIISKYKGFIRL